MLNGVAFVFRLHLVLGMTIFLPFLFTLPCACVERAV